MEKIIKTTITTIEVEEDSRKEITKTKIKEKKDTPTVVITTITKIPKIIIFNSIGAEITTTKMIIISTKEKIK